MSDELKPCPFCGGGLAKSIGNASFSGVELMGAGTERPYVWCGTCGVSARSENTDAKAIAAWNTRAAPRVKPLVWGKIIPKYCVDECITQCMRYKIVMHYDKSGHVLSFHRFGKPVRIEAPTGAVGFDVLKAAAQADYESRILAALL